MSSFHFSVPKHIFFSPVSALTSGSLSDTDFTRPPVVGILGGIGSGKSSVVRHLSGLNLFIIDADRIGHELLKDGRIQDQIRTHFGDAVFSDSSTVDRSQLARRVFGQTTEHESARQQLNSILHPAIRREIHSQIKSAPRDADALILDAALLLEGGWDATCDWLIFVDTPLEIRQQRVRENRNWSPEELARREATQWSIQRKKDRADFVVDNSGSIEQAAFEMKQALQSVLSKNDRS